MPEPEGFYTDKNGVTRPITKRKTADAVVAGAVVAGLMTAAGGGGATASVGAALDSATSTNSDAKTTSSEDAARKGDDTTARQRMAMKELKKTIKQRLRCGLQSTGQIQQFFLKTPCESLDELLLALGDAKGDIIVVSVAWVEMSSKDEAIQLKTLEDTYGTGDITPIAMQILELRGSISPERITPRAKTPPSSSCQRPNPSMATLPRRCSTTCRRSPRSCHRPERALLMAVLHTSVRPVPSGGRGSVGVVVVTRQWGRSLSSRRPPPRVFANFERTQCGPPRYRTVSFCSSAAA